jgi:YVTN family beta-propeller protein
MPLRIAPAADGKSMLIVTGGYHDHSLEVIDPEHATVRQHIALGKAWAGLAVDGARRAIYVSGGGPVTSYMRQDREVAALPARVQASLIRPIIRLSWQSDSAAVEQPVAIPGLDDHERFIAGMAMDGQGHLFVVNAENDSLYKLDPTTDRVLARAPLGPGPFQLALAPDESTVAVGNAGDQTVSLLDAATLAQSTRIRVGMHPTDLTYARDGRLFVANAGSNSVSVIQGSQVSETILTSLRSDDPLGSTPNGVVVSADGSRMYVANADNNDVAVIDVHTPGHSRVLGFIPTAWYPSALALTPDGRQLVVGIAKGVGTRANWPAQDKKHMQTFDASKEPFDYIGRVMTGYAEIIPVPDLEQLASYTNQVNGNLPIADREITQAEHDSAQAAFQHITHVIFIIRENHTYDQDLGDDPRGDGRKELTYFAQALPNVHALVKQTPLLDHYFLNGEVSNDGHYWANSAYATAFDQRDVASDYEY